MKSIVMFLAIALLAACGSKSVEIELKNNLDIERKAEIVEVSLAELGFRSDAQLVVKNAEGEEIPSQQTFDGKLIFAADLLPSGSAVYVVSVGTPSEYTVYACGRVYPERVDDLAWESDLAAYRIYGPALQASGERAFGNDVWLKNNTDLPVVEARYATELDPATRARIRELKKSDKKAAKELADAVSYHIDHGNGFDPYKVGPTLGAGTTAVLSGGEIVYPYCYTDCKVLDNGPLRFTAEVTYLPTVIDGTTLTEHRTISIDKGSWLNRTTVRYDGAADELDVLSGIVLHEEKGETFICDGCHAVGHIDPVEGDKAEVGEIYIGMLFPEGWSGAEERMFSDAERKATKAFGHAAVYNTLAPETELTYFWGAAWSKATVRPMPSFEAWKNYLAEQSRLAASPIEITIK